MGQQEIYDIYDNLDKISFFPIATGYWLILSLIFFIIIAYYLAKLYLLKKQQSWRYQAKKQIAELLTQSEININDLHQLIKKIIIQVNVKDKSLAGLYGAELILYLQNNDPYKFDWKKNAQILLLLFTPKQKAKNSTEIKNIILAIQKWL